MSIAQPELSSVAGPPLRATDVSIPRTRTRKTLGQDCTWSQAFLLGSLFAALKLAIHIGLNLRAQHVGYGMFRDELYYIVCGRRLAWGYLDNQPLIAVLARISDHVFGHERLWAFRMMPSVAGALKVLLTGFLTRALGGRRAAQALAMIMVIASPEYLGIDTFFSMNTLEPVFWMTAMLAVIEIIKIETGSSHRALAAWWILFGVAGGLALETKLSGAFFLICLLSGLLLTPQRRILQTWWAAAGTGLLLFIELPNFLWQWHRQFPSVQWLIAASHEGKDVVLSPPAFLWQQVLVMIPFYAIFWAGGILWLLSHQSARRFRFAGFTALLFFGLMMALHAKVYYVVPIYPMLYAAGCVYCFQLLPRGAGWQAAALAYGFIPAIAAWYWMPVVLPLVPPAQYSSWEHRLHFRPEETENFQKSPLPQLLADMSSWPEFVRQVATAYNSLPADVRAHTGIYCGNYGEASALDVYGGQYGLPAAISGHQTYWFWGPRGQLRDTMIVVGQTQEDVGKTFRDVHSIGVINTPYAMPFENGDHIWLAEGMKRSPDIIWPSTKNWY